MPVDPGGSECACGQRGCLETLCSGSAIARMWPAALFAAAAAGDPVARSVRAGVLRGVAAAVRVVALTLDVEVIVLGGAVSRLGEPLLTGVREELTTVARASPFLASLDLPSRLRLAPSEELGAVGAALLGGAASGGDGHPKPAAGEGRPGDRQREGSLRESPEHMDVS